MFPMINLSLLKGLLKKIDMYGAPISLNFRQQTAHQSIVGGVMTIVTIIAIVVLTFQGAIALVERSNSYVQKIYYQIQAQTLYQFDPTDAIIDTDLFQFYIGMTQGWSLKDNFGRSLFNITVEVISVQGTKTYPIQSVQILNCEGQNFESINGLNYSSQYQALGLSSALCSVSKQRLAMRGRLLSDDYTYIKISIRDNQNKKYGYNYRELTEYKKKMGLGHPTFRIGFTNSFLDTGGSQLKPFLSQTEYQLSDLNQLAYVNIPVERTTFSDDKSIVPKLEDIQSQVFVNAKPESLTNCRKRNKNEQEYAIIQMFLSQQEQFIYKSYDKIDMYLAYVGGIIQIFLLVLGYFVQRYNKYAFYVSLANRLYTFDLHPSRREKYDRQNADSEENFLTIDQIKKRLMSRIQKIKQTLSKFKNGTRNMIKKNQIVMLLMQKHSVSIQSPSSSSRKDQDYGPEDQIQYENFRTIPEDDSELGTNIKQEPHAQKIKTSAHQKSILEAKGHLSSPILPLRFQDIKSKLSEIQNGSPRNRKKYDAIEEDVSIVDLDFSDKRTFLEQSFCDILKYTKQIRMSALYMVTKMFCRRIFFRKNETIQLLDRAIKMLKYDTDLVKILEKLQDIDKLKKIILNDDQQVVFNYTPKPIVKARRSIRRSLLKFETELEETYKQMNQPNPMEEQSLLQSKKHFHTIKSFFKLYNAYDRLYHSSQTLSKVETQFNSRLMLLIGQDLREVFEVSQYLQDNHQEIDKPNTENINSESMASFGSFTSIKQKSMVTSKNIMLSSFGKLNSQRKILEG